MRLWISSETSKEVLSEEQSMIFYASSNYVQDTICAYIESISYDIPLEGWDCIIVMMGENGFDERIYYSLKRKYMDFRLKIDHILFNMTDELGRQKLIFEMLIRSLNLLKEKFKIARPKINQKAFDELERLREDVMLVAKLQGWI